MAEWSKDRKEVEFNHTMDFKRLHPSTKLILLQNAVGGIKDAAIVETMDELCLHSANPTLLL